MTTTTKTTTFTLVPKLRGSTMLTINVDRNGKPFGQIWTFRERGCKCKVNVKLLDGRDAKLDTIEQAKRFAREA